MLTIVLVFTGPDAGDPVQLADVGALSPAPPAACLLKPAAQ
jgi:hypothetical protein